MIIPKMGGVIFDIVYDHLLWQYELKHQKLNLKEEIKRYYKTLDAQKSLMPDWIKFMYTYMKEMIGSQIISTSGELKEP